MKVLFAGITGIMLLTMTFTGAEATNVPDWVKNNAAWWGGNLISDDDFISGVQYMIEEGIITIPSTTRSSATSDTIPDWVKNNALWFGNGDISENDFVNGLQYLIKMGIMQVSPTAVSDDGASKSQYQSTPQETSQSQSSGNTDLDEMLAQCQGGENAREIRDCEKAIKEEYKLATYMNNGQKHQIGNVAYYYVADYQEETRKGVKQFNNIAYTATGQALLNLQILVQNTGTGNETLTCTSPAICNYSVWDGGKKWVNSGSDFTSGNIVLKPGQAKFANILWGPAIGYGSYENFDYDSGKDYYLRVSEPFGSMDIPLNLVIVQ